MMTFGFSNGHKQTGVRFGVSSCAGEKLRTQLGGRKGNSSPREASKTFTRAGDTSIFPMPAVVGEPAGVGALSQVGLGPRTLHVVQKDGAGALAEAGLSGGGHG